jgi:hypothetical protein
MHTSTRSSFTLFSALLTGLLCATGCDDGATTSDRYVAFTPTLGEHVSEAVALAIDSQRAEIELADGEVVELALGAPEGDDLIGACDQAFADSDRTVLPVLERPLVVGDRTFAEPVLEASCHAETASNQLVLRDAADASCTDGDCLHFAAPDAVAMSVPTADEQLAFTANDAEPEATHCAPVGTRVCISCGNGQYRPRTVTSVFDGNANHHCVYSYSYGSCSFACSE